MAFDPVLPLLAAISFGFALLLAGWIRQLEARYREPWTKVLTAFLYGAILTTIGGASLSILLLAPIRGFGDLTPFDPTLFGILSAVVIAPVAEELMKALGILGIRSWIREVEDGIVFGAAVGLGFASTENVLYFSAALAATGPVGLIATVIVRSLSSTLLHLGATGLAGYGFGLYYARCGERAPWWAFVLGAILLHAIFNLLGSLQLFARDLLEGVLLSLGGLFLATLITWSLFFWLQLRVRELDRGTPYECS